MKRALCSCLILAIGFLGGCAPGRPRETKASQKGELVLTYWDHGTEGQDRPGYDTKMKVFIDGELAGESAVAGRFERKSLSIVLEPGSHVVIIEGFARRNGEWEKRTKERGAIVDHRLDKEIEILAGQTRTINFVVPEAATRLDIRL